MSRPFPPELQALLDKAKELGIEVQVFGGDENKPKEDVCPCPVCSMRRARAAAQPASSSFAPGEKGTGETGPAETKLDSVMLYLERITNELGENIAKLIGAGDERSLARDQDLRRVTDELHAKLNVQSSAQRSLNIAQNERIQALEETVRRQVGLLHKRVTKRKQEIGTKSNRRLSAQEKLARSKI